MRLFASKHGNGIYTVMDFSTSELKVISSRLTDAVTKKHQTPERLVNHRCQPHERRHAAQRPAAAAATA